MASRFYISRGKVRALGERPSDTLICNRGRSRIERIAGLCQVEMAVRIRRRTGSSPWQFVRKGGSYKRGGPAGRCRRTHQSVGSHGTCPWEDRIGGRERMMNIVNYETDVKCREVLRLV